MSKLIYYGKNQISVSAYKNLVVLSSRESNNAFGDNTFNLLLVDKNSDFVKRLTLKGKNMMPVFSSDGSTILFIIGYRFDSKFGIIRLKENKIKSLDDYGKWRGLVGYYLIVYYNWIFVKKKN